METVFERHRGPYRLLVARPFVTKPTFTRGQWLKGELPFDEVYSEAMSLLGDPRDTIQSIAVWSARDQQFVMTYTKKDLEQAAA